MKTVHERALIAIMHVALLFLAACSRDKQPDPQPEPVRDQTGHKYSHLIREIHWETFDYKASINYRADSSIEHIRYSAASGQTDLKTHEYKADVLSSIELASSLSKKVYEYDGAGRLKTIHLVRKNAGPYDNAQKLVFLYDDAGAVQKLERYQITPAGTSLDVAHHYEYDKSGKLFRVRSEQSNGYKTITTLKEYSIEFDHDPWLFIEEFGNPDYAIYNFPVLHATKGRLPGTLIYEVPDTDGTFKTERTTVQQFEVKDKKVQRLKIAVHYPEHPNLDNESEISFAY
jgi:hypothetical protein